MQLTILQASTFALDNFTHASDLTVHSVYQKAVNLTAGDQMLTLQPRGSVLSPISLITDCTESELAELPFTAGEKLSVTLNTTCTLRKDLFLPLGSTDTMSSSGDFPRLSIQIREAIAMAGPTPLPAHMRGMELILNQPELLDESLYMNAASQYLAQFHQIFQTSGDLDQMAACLCHLIGLGIGLTPSGDDFLCGFLAGLRLSDPAAWHAVLPEKVSSADEKSVFLSLMGQHILHALDRTNEISAAFLRCAVLGQFSAPIHLLKDPNVTVECIYQAFSGIGHSSGIDTLCGLYTALHL